MKSERIRKKNEAMTSHLKYMGSDVMISFRSGFLASPKGSLQVTCEDALLIRSSYYANAGAWYESTTLMGGANQRPG